jgi:hypothetical protein
MIPAFQAIKIQTNSKIENPTRMAKALAMRLDLEGAFSPPRIMKYKAAARLPKMTTKAIATRYDMTGIIQ